MLRAIAFGIGLCAVFALVLYVYYSGDTTPRPGSAEQPANYRALTKLTWIDFSLVSPQVGWLLLGNTQNFPEDGRILATRDGGNTWYAQLSGPVLAMQFADEQNGWAYVFSNNQATSTSPAPEKSACQCLKATHDGGRSWQELPTPPKYLRSFKFVSEHDGWAVTVTTGDRGYETRLFRTMDGGVSWQERKLPPEIASSPVALESAKDEHTSWLSFCREADCRNRDLAVTIDGGVTWQTISSPCAFSPEVSGRLGQYFIGSFLSENEWWVLCSTGDKQATVLYKTSDRGVHWLLAAESSGPGGLAALPPLYSGFNPPVWGDIGFLNPNDGWIAVGGPSGGPFVTHDGGATWKDTRLFELPASRASFLDDNTHGWAMTGVSLLSTDDGGATWHQIYPPERR